MANSINKNKPTEQKFLELIVDGFMNGIPDCAKRKDALRQEIVSDDGIFAVKFSVSERLELAKICDKL